MFVLAVMQLREALLHLTRGVSVTKKRRLLSLCYCLDEHVLNGPGVDGGKRREGEQVGGTHS